MSDEVTEVETPEVDGAKPDTELGTPGIAALKAERAARAAAEKTMNELAAKVKAFEDRDKTESEKAQEQLAALAERATKAERETARLAVIAKHQIPAEFHDLIQGVDEETLEAAAAKIRALIDTKAPSDRATLIIPDEGGHPNLALNGDGIESALRKALGIG